MGKKLLAFVLMGIISISCIAPIHAAENHTLAISDDVLALLNDEISGEDDNNAKIVDVAYSKDKNGTESFDITYELIPQNAHTRAIGIGVASFKRLSKKNTWSGKVSVTLPEVITSVYYQLDWKDGIKVTGGGGGTGKKTYTSVTWQHTYKKAGTYRPVFATQVYGVSGPYGTIAVPSLNSIVILFDL